MKHNLLFLFLIISFLFPKIGFTQTNYEDVVYLKNGSIIHGMIIEQVPNESIKIQTKDRNIFVYKMDEVLKITKEEVQPAVPVARTEPAPPPPPKKEKKISGYTNITEWYFQRTFSETESYSGNNGIPYESHFDRINNGPSFGIQTVNGYQFNPYFSMGAGVGMQAYEQLFLIPFFMDVRATFLNQRFTPFAAGEFGYAFTRHQVFGFNTEYEDEGGLTASIDAGIKYFVLPRMALNFSLGYRYQEINVTEEYNGWYGNDILTKRSMNHLNVRVGFTF